MRAIVAGDQMVKKITFKDRHFSADFFGRKVFENWSEYGWIIGWVCRVILKQ